MLAFLSSSWDILLASQSLSRVLFRIPSVPTCGAARLVSLGSVFASPCPDCPSSFGSAVSPAGIAFHSLETDSEIEFFISSTGNFTHFGPHEEVEERSDRWGHRILWTTSSTFLGSGCLECMIVRLLLVTA